MVAVASVEMWVGGGIGFGVAWEVAVEMALLLHVAVVVFVKLINDVVLDVDVVDVDNVLLPLQLSFVEVLLLVVVVGVVLSVLSVSDAVPSELGLS